MNLLEFTIILAILVNLFFTLVKYSKEGDISVMFSEVPSTYKLSKMYKTKSEVIDRLHKIITYKHNFVRWNKFLIVAIFIAFLIVYFYRKKFVTSEILILSGIIFLVIDLPNRWAGTHIYKPLDLEAGRLSGISEKLK